MTEGFPFKTTVTATPGGIAITTQKFKGHKKSHKKLARDLQFSNFVVRYEHREWDKCGRTTKTLVTSRWEA